ncbi:MAG: hypothetical protein N2645_04505 [Clostridia bacterium]|nr:hypothetical protein [Clostridia bacterium]
MKLKFRIVLMVSFILLLSGAVMAVNLNSRMSGSDIKTVNLLGIPGIFILMGVTLENLIQNFFSGRLAFMLAGTMKKLFLGLAAIAFIMFIPETFNFMFGMILVIYLILLLAHGYISLTVKRFATYSVLRSVSYVIQGILVWTIMHIVWDRDGGHWMIGIDLSAADMAMAGYFALSVFSLLALFSLNESPFSKYIGKWSQENTIGKFFYGAGVVFVFKDVPKVIDTVFKEDAFTAQLVLMVFILIILFINIKSLITHSRELEPHDNLSRHMLSLKFFNHEELEMTTEYIRSFVEQGEKSRIIAYIALRLQLAGMPVELVARLIYPMIHYKDVSLPLICRRSEALLIEEKNRKSRRNVLEYTIQMIEYYGGQ